MSARETVYLGGMPLGRMHWDRDANLARFESERKELSSLSVVAWKTPDACRQAVRERAMRVLRDDLTAKEVAEKFNVSVRTVRRAHLK